jgi:hypothetical protein
VQSAAQGEHPVTEIVHNAGAVKLGTTPKRRCSAIGGSRSFAEDLGCLVTFSEERTHASYVLIPRIGSKGPLPAASAGFTKREARVVRVTCIITR